MTTTQQINQLKQAIAGGETLAVALSEQQRFELRKWLYTLRYRLFCLENDVLKGKSAVEAFQVYMANQNLT